MTATAPALWICGQGSALPTTPQGQQQQQRSIHALHKPVNLTRQLHNWNTSGDGGLRMLYDLKLQTIVKRRGDLPKNSEIAFTGCPIGLHTRGGEEMLCMPAALRSAVILIVTIIAVGVAGFAATEAAPYPTCATVPEDLTNDKKAPRYQPPDLSKKFYVFHFYGYTAKFSKKEDQVNNKHLYDHITNLSGAYLEGFWDYFWANRYTDYSDPKERLPNLQWKWNIGTCQVARYIAMLPWDKPIIIAGYSLGGSAAVSLARYLNEKQHGRAVASLILIDAVGAGGKRANTIKNYGKIPGNVNRFINRWQDRGCLPKDYNTSGKFEVAEGMTVVENDSPFSLPTDIKGGKCKRCSGDGAIVHKGKCWECPSGTKSTGTYYNSNLICKGKCPEGSKLYMVPHKNRCRLRGSENWKA